MSRSFSRLDDLLNTIDEQIKDINAMSPDEIRFKSLVVGTEGFPISQNMAIRIVGGKKRLAQLIQDGAIRYLSEPQMTDTANKKHAINFADCIRNTKPRLLKIRKMNNAASTQA